MSSRDGRPDWNEIEQGLTPSTFANVYTYPSVDESGEIIAANPYRKGFKIFNNSTQVLYVKYGSEASSSDFSIKLAAGAYFENAMPVYLGSVHGVWAAVNGSAQITELT